MDIKNQAEIFGDVAGYQVRLIKGAGIHVDESLSAWVPDPDGPADHYRWIFRICLRAAT